jgi:predicted DCC family thiol-disulfide oxidoreductase YuxK
VPSDHLASIVFVERNRVHLHSSAILRACGYLRFPWPAVKVFLGIPCFLRNWVYRWIARNRYRWFGTTEDCPTPRPEDADSFI